MKVLHITPAYHPASRYGGPIEAVHQLCCQLSDLGCEVRVLTTDADGQTVLESVEKDRWVEVSPGIRVRYCRRVASQSISPHLIRTLPDSLRWADVVHLTAVYSFPTIPSLIGCRAFEKPVVWSPRGALDGWQGSRRRVAKSVWETICRLVAPRRLILHATSDAEAERARLRFPSLKAVVIPNGVQVPDEVSNRRADKEVRLLFLGRLHPKKGIENLLDACRSLDEVLGVTWSLTIAGAGDPLYTEHLTNGVHLRGLDEKVTFAGWADPTAKQHLLSQATVVVVPSYTENFGMVVAESLAHGVPVIVSRGAPWARVEELGCGLWVRNDPESLVSALRQIERMPLRQMGEKGRAWMRKEFAWPQIAAQMMGAYQRLLAESQ